MTEIQKMCGALQRVKDGIFWTLSDAFQVFRENCAELHMFVLVSGVLTSLHGRNGIPNEEDLKLKGLVRCPLFILHTR